MILVTDPATNSRRPRLTRVIRTSLRYESNILRLFVITLGVLLAFWIFAWIELHGYPASALKSPTTVQSRITAVASFLIVVAPLVIPIGSLGPRIADAFDAGFGSYLFTQGISRRRWLVVELIIASVMTTVLAIVSACGFRFIVAPHAGNIGLPDWGQFFTVGPSVIGIGLAVTAVVTLLALYAKAPTVTQLLGVIAFVAILFFGSFLYPRLLTPDQVSGPYVIAGQAALRANGITNASPAEAANAVAFNNVATPTNADVVFQTYAEHHHPINFLTLIKIEARCALPDGKLNLSRPVAACRELRSITTTIDYQPASRYDPLEWLMTLILTGLALIFVAFSYTIIDRQSI